MTLNTDRNVRWLHISDLHMKAENFDSDVVLGAFLRSMPSLIERAGPPDFVIVSGDIANFGKAAEYDQASKFLDKLLMLLNIERRFVYVIPGNHDVDRSRGKGLARTLVGERDSDAYFDPSEPLPHLVTRQSDFIKWYDSYFAGVRRFESASTASLETLSIRGIEIAILLLNTASFCIDDDDFSKLWVGRRSIGEAVQLIREAAAALKLAVMHHPFSWLAPAEQGNIKSEVRSSVDLILSGHLHVTDVESSLAQYGSALHLAAGALYQTRQWPNTALFCQSNGADVVVFPVRYEDKPTEVWTLDPSVFSSAADFLGRFDVPRSMGIPTTASNQRPDVTMLAKQDFERDLFSSSGGAQLYVEPRLMTRAQQLTDEAGEVPSRVTVDDLVDGVGSTLIEARSEFGGSSLARRLAYEFSLRGTIAVKRDAKDLPNYRKKLELEFPSSEPVVVVVDNLDLDRDERLLRELAAMPNISRIIGIAMNRGAKSARLSIPKISTLQFSHLFLWQISRGDVRQLTHGMFLSADDVFISKVVDKVYRDLLGLCIPLTPANVIMYLKVLHRDGEINPLNRVDIIGRYIADALSTSSDSFADSFSNKSKMDVLSAFCHAMFIERVTEFDDRYWINFIDRHKKETLSQFDGNLLLDQLISNKIIVRIGKFLFFRYTFYFNFFFGRYLSHRQSSLLEFIRDEKYFECGGAVDVITGLSSDNTFFLTSLTKKLESVLNQFRSKYMRADFDPLILARWPDNPHEELEFWPRVSQQIESGPAPTNEIDIIKTSLIAEVRTADQQLTFDSFLEIESSLFHLSELLGDALRNSDSVSGDAKIQAFEMLLESNKIALQVGSFFADELAKVSHFKWGGVEFYDFDKAPKEMGNISARSAVMIGLATAISGEAGPIIGIQKLAGVFHAREHKHGGDGFVDLVNFNCIVHSRGEGWFDACERIVERLDRNSFYLQRMLSRLMDKLRHEVMQNRDRDLMKRLVATIHAKRAYKTKSPGSKVVGRVLEYLEKDDAFHTEKDD